MREEGGKTEREWHNGGKEWLDNALEKELREMKKREKIKQKLP